MTEELISFQCIHCQTLLNVPYNLAGVTGPCPTCGATITAPMAGAGQDLGNIASPPDPSPEAESHYVSGEENIPVHETEMISGINSEPLSPNQYQGSREENIVDPQQVHLGNEPHPPQASPTSHGLEPDFELPTPDVEQRRHAPEESVARDPATTPLHLPLDQNQARPEHQQYQSVEVVKPKSKSKSKSRSQSTEPRKKKKLLPFAFAGVVGCVLAVIAAYGIPKLLTGSSSAKLPSSSAPQDTPNTIDTGKVDVTPAPGKHDFQDLAKQLENSTNKPSQSVDGTRSSRENDSEDLDLNKLYKDDPDSLLYKPRLALDKFLKAADWKERAKFSKMAYLDMEARMEEEMEAYYSDPNHRDGPIHAASTTFQTSDKTGNSDYMFYLFHLTFDDIPEGFPVAVEETADGFKIDWQSFVEFRDMHLKKYFSDPSEESAKFHVIMERSHYFKEDVPDPNGKICFRIEPPVPGNEGYVFVDKKSPLMEKLEKDSHLDWNTTSFPVVKIQWRSEQGKSYVELVDIVADYWRAEGGGASEIEAESAPKTADSA